MYPSPKVKRIRSSAAPWHEMLSGWIICGAQTTEAMTRFREWRTPTDNGSQWRTSGTQYFVEQPRPARPHVLQELPPIRSPSRPNRKRSTVRLKSKYSYVARVQESESGREVQSRLIVQAFASQCSSGAYPITPHLPPPWEAYQNNPRTTPALGSARWFLPLSPMPQNR